MPLTGHLNPMIGLARRLKSRGHEVIFVGMLDTKHAVQAAELNFVSLCEAEHPLGWVYTQWTPVARMQGMDPLAYHAVKILPALLVPALEQLPTVLEKHGINALVLDT